MSKSFLQIAAYDFSEKFKGDKPDYIFERMILFQIETMVSYKSILLYIANNNVDGLRKELSKYGNAEKFLKLIEDSNLDNNVVEIQKIVFDFFKEYLKQKVNFSEEQVIDKSLRFCEYIVNKDSLKYFNKTEDQIPNIEEIDIKEQELYDFIIGLIKSKKAQKRK